MLGWLTGGSRARTLRTQCAACGRTAAEAGLRKGAGRWTLVYHGIVSGTGPDGSEVARDRVQGIVRAFRRPYSDRKFERADLYDRAGFCTACRKVYCWTHWGQPVGGGGRCPRGHFQSLDPHFSPEWSDDA